MAERRQSLDYSMPLIFSQQKENWRYAARLSALCAHWQVYSKLQYGQCLQKYVVYAVYPEELFSVIGISSLCDLNYHGNLEEYDAIT